MRITKPGKKTGRPVENDMRGRIMEATLDLIAEKGMDHVSVREIVARCGVTKPVLYYYFKDKNDLYRKLGEQATQELLLATKELELSNQSVDEFVEMLLTCSLQEHLKRPTLARFGLRMLSLAPEEDKFAKYFFEMTRTHTVILTKAFTLAEKRGEIPPGSAHNLWALTVATFQYFMVSIALGLKADLTEATPKILTGIIMAGIRHSSKEKKKAK